MPIDAISRRDIIVRHMPWKGRNAAIIRQREAAPRLPPNWGASFTQRPRHVGEMRAAAVVDVAETSWLHERSAKLLGGKLADRLYRLLTLLAACNQPLPTAVEFADALGVEVAEIFAAYTSLSRGRRIQRCAPVTGLYAFEQAVKLETGAVISTPGMPASAACFAS